MIEKLTTPVTVDTPYGPVSATHQAWGHNHHPWNRTVSSFKVLGVMVNGKFRPIAGQEQTVDLRDADYDSLMASNTSGKQQDVFRTTDVIAKHKERAARPTNPNGPARMVGQDEEAPAPRKTRSKKS